MEALSALTNTLQVPGTGARNKRLLEEVAAASVPRYTSRLKGTASF